MTTQPQSSDDPNQQPDQPDNREAIPPLPKPSDKTPEEFYAEITQRHDTRAILEALARD